MQLTRFNQGIRRMVKASEVYWVEKISLFKQQRSRTQTQCVSFLLDILQGLYEDITEKLKIELLLILQEWGDVLIQGQESAEQAVGSIKSILEDLHRGHHDKHFVTHCLVSTTSLIIQFDVFQFNPSLVHEITQIFLNICKRVNTQGETVIRKTACECLIELETAIPLVLSTNVYQLFDLAKQENSCASQIYMLLVSTVMQNLLDCENEGNVPLILDNDDAVDKMCIRDAQQIASYIASEFNHMSPEILWYLGQTASTLFRYLKMPEVVLQNKMIECCHSSNLQMLHLGLLLGLDQLRETVTLQDLMVINKCVLNKILLPTFSNGIRAMCLDWLLEVVKQIDFLSDETESLVCSIFFLLRKQLTLDSPQLMQMKMETMSMILKMYPQAFDFFMCLEIPLKLAHNGILGPQLSILYRSFSLVFTQAEEMSLKNKIKDHIVEMTLKAPGFIAYTIDFIKCIENDFAIAIRRDLIHKIANFILRQKTRNFFTNSHSFFPLLELACSEKGLWPLGIIKWMKLYCLQSNICRSGNWEFGCHLLSVCKAVLANHQDVEVLYELTDFLWFLLNKFNDQDIRDRALFFYLIIGHSSPKYFQKMFGRPVEDSKIQPHNKKTDIDMPAELVQGILPTIRYNEKIIEIDKSTNYQLKRISDDKSIHFDCYEGYMKTLVESFEIAININLKIRFATNVDTNKLPTKAYALSIKFNSNGKCKDISEVHLPYLCMTSSCDRKFSHKCTVLKIEPTEAIPFDIQAFCTFTNQDERNCFAPVSSIKLTFSDFFHPLICISGSGSNDSNDSCLFDRLWDYCEKNVKSSKTRNQSCVMSLKRLLIKEKSIRKIIGGHWNPFLIVMNGDEIKIGIFLSPGYHFLMLLAISTEETLVKFCLDNWKLLEIVENYLEDILS